jgi:hypothetical protein
MSDWQARAICACAGAAQHLLFYTNLYEFVGAKPCLCTLFAFECDSVRLTCNALFPLCVVRFGHNFSDLFAHMCHVHAGLYWAWLGPEPFAMSGAMLFNMSGDKVVDSMKMGRCFNLQIRSHGYP